jgi:dolichyl-phosphate beta-glucosyltransferase
MGMRRRRILGECFNRLARWILDLPYRDTQAGIKGFRLNAARRIFENSSISGFGFDVELLFIAKKLGCNTTEIAADVSVHHSYKKGKLKLIKDSVIMFGNLFLIRYNNFLRRYD